MSVIADNHFLKLALRLARRAYGETSPNPMVGAMLVKNQEIIGRGWHRKAGGPHAEIEALRDAERRKHPTKGSTLYVTLEPCCTHGRTPPCTNAIIEAGIKRVVIGTMDPNPQHSGNGLEILRRAGIHVTLVSQQGNQSDSQAVADECVALNDAFNHWIVHRTPLVTVKSAMTLDGKIATSRGESKWITGEKARSYTMKLRQGSDAILVGIKTVLADDPQLTVRAQKAGSKTIRRIVIDPHARTPLSAKVASDELARFTTIVVSKAALKARITKLAKVVNVLVAPTFRSMIDLRWLMKKLGSENVTSLLVEGGGETNALFFKQQIAHRVELFYAPKIIGGRESRKSVSGEGIRRIDEAVRLSDVEWKKFGEDLLLRAQVVY